MKKGEWMRTSILETSEKLFFEKGYDNTSVQDILDRLELSKGGFYHHFPSKEAVLSEILSSHVEKGVEALKASLEGERMSPIARMDRVLGAVNLLSDGDVSYGALMVRICYMNGDPVIRTRLRALQLDALRPLFEAAFAMGVSADAFFSRFPGRLADIVLSLVADVDDRTYMILAQQADRPEFVLEVMDELDAGRMAVEELLGAPYGSIQLFDPARLLECYRQAADELMRLEAR